MIRVVIADDAKPMRDRLKAELRRYPGGCEIVAECEDGSAAIEATQQLNPDVTMLDVVMAPMDGVEAGRKLQALGHKVILVTSSGQGGVLQDFSYLIKPYGLAQLFRSIATAIAR